MTPEEETRMRHRFVDYRNLRRILVHGAMHRGAHLAPVRRAYRVRTLARRRRHR